MPALIKNARSIFHLPDFNRHPVFRFIAKRSGPFDGSVKLTRDRVYIIPTKAGLIFGILLLTLLIGSINYEKSLGFVLTFLLTGIGNILLLSTWRNIAGLEVKGNDASPIFCGETAVFSVRLINHQLLDRHSIAISQHGIKQDIVDCKANSNQPMHFGVTANRRGRLDSGRFRLYSEFPSGLFVAWTWLDLSMSCMVYPAPETDITLPFFYHSDTGDADTYGNGMENFSHLRKYQKGDKMNRISWKAAAKTDKLFSKEFIGATPVTQWINWHEITARDNEHRLSIITALIINAENKQQHYGLRLPDIQIAPDHGHRHFHRCLTELALF
ncbi:MAG: DUF58 domain-containing protein [Gammaproteobacteria bacterium]|nr:DUF58 domain-containing protein [Gammaproteobacteria bacterium]